MKWRRYLIGVFVLVFLLSTSVLGLLLVEESQDLSSRASIGGVERNMEVEGVEEEGWMVEEYKDLIAGEMVRVGFASGSWERKGDLLVNEVAGISVKLASSATSDQVLLSSVLTSQYELVDSLQSTGTRLANAKAQSFRYTFFGEEVVVQIFEIQVGGGMLKALAIMPGLEEQRVVEELLANVSTGEVKGVNDTDSSIKVASLVRPSVVRVVTSMCAKARLVAGGVDYRFCGASTGSGFFVTSQGHVATNGHVVKMLPETALSVGVQNGTLKTMLADILALKARESGVESVTTTEQIEELYGSVESLLRLGELVERMQLNGEISVSGEEYKFYVQLGKTPAVVTSAYQVETGEDIVTAELIGVDYEGVSDQGFKSSDIGLLKMNAVGNYPALELGEANVLSSGEAIQIFGFPGVVGGSSQEIPLDVSASGEPTITRGVVSAIKEARGDRKRLIQTDASITHGNSGGPAVDEGGKVIGIATYGLIDDQLSGNFNFLRDVMDLKQLMESNGVVREKGVYEKWKQGLESFWLGYYRFAVEDFREVKELYPSHPTVNEYAQIAVGKVGSLEDKTPRFTRTQRRGLMAVSGVSAVLGLIGILALGSWSLIEKKKQPGFGGAGNIYAERPPV